MGGESLGQKSIGAVAAGDGCEGAGSIIVAGVIGYSDGGGEGGEEREKDRGSWELHFGFGGLDGGLVGLVGKLRR